jgi:hypothetical protein
MQEPPHLMLFGTKLDTKVYSTDPHSGPWIMWTGTPYEHLMVPVKWFLSNWGGTTCLPSFSRKSQSQPRNIRVPNIMKNP